MTVRMTPAERIMFDRIVRLELKAKEWLALVAAADVCAHKAGPEPLTDKFGGNVDLRKIIEKLQYQLDDSVM